MALLCWLHARSSSRSSRKAWYLKKWVWPMKVLHEYPTISEAFLKSLEVSKRFPEVASKFCKEVQIENENNGTFNCLQFPSVSNGKQYIYFSKDKKKCLSEERLGLIGVPLTPPVETLWICEGNTDWLAAKSIFTNVLGMPGANSVSAAENSIEYLKALDPRQIIIIMDNDEAGRKGAISLAKYLTPNLNSKVHVFDWKDLDHKDLREWILSENSTDNILSFISSWIMNNLNLELVEKLIDQQESVLKLPLCYSEKIKSLMTAISSSNGSTLLYFSDRLKLESIGNDGSNNLGLRFKDFNYLQTFDNFSKTKVKEILSGPINPLCPFSKIKHIFENSIYLEEKGFYTFLSCFVILSYCYPIFQHVPFLHVNGPKGSGKSSVCKLLAELSFNGEHFVTPTMAVVRRLLDEKRGVPSFDDCEFLSSTNSDNQEFRSLLNSSYYTDAKSVFNEAQKGGSYKPRFVFVGGPKVFNNIQGLDPVLLSRCLVVKTSYAPEKWSFSRELKIDGNLLSTLRTEILLWTFANQKNISECFLNLRQEKNRDWDLVSPVRAIAEVVSTSTQDQRVKSDVELALSISLDNRKNYSQDFDSVLIDVLYEVALEKNLLTNFDIFIQDIAEKLQSYDYPLPNNTHRLRSEIGKTLKSMGLEIGSVREQKDQGPKLTKLFINLEHLRRLKKKLSAANTGTGVRHE